VRFGRILKISFIFVNLGNKILKFVIRGENEMRNAPMKEHMQTRGIIASAAQVGKFWKNGRISLLSMNKMDSFCVCSVVK